MLDQPVKRDVKNKRGRDDSASKALAKLHGVVQSPYSYLGDLKRLGNRKLVGCTGLYVPEELIHAAGLVPVALPSSSEPVTLAATRLHSSVCGYVRSVVVMGMKGELGMFDGFVWQDCCPALRGGSDVMKRNTPDVGWFKVLCFPKVTRGRPRAGGFIIDEILEFKQLLEQATGCEITADRLQASIDIYNENRALLRMVYDMRRLKPALISAQDMQAIVRSSMVMPKEEHTGLLRTVVEAWKESGSTTEKRVRLVVSGSLCQGVATELLDVIDPSRALVVDDDLYVGSRYIYGDVETLGDPIEALVQRYLRMPVPCPTRHPPATDWGEHLVQLVGRSRADGVVTLIVKYCEPHLLYYPRVRRYLQSKGIPELMLDVENENRVSDLAQKKTRIESFVEILEGQATLSA